MALCAALFCLSIVDLIVCFVQNFTTKFVRTEKGALSGLFSAKLKQGSTNGTVKLESGNKV